jgi:ATP-dependent RNA helicase SUPV3L1/SUV3
MDPDLVEAVEQHHFQPAVAAEWRNAKLDFASLTQLMRSLARPPEREGLKLAAEALDEITLRQLAADPDVADRVRDKATVMRLWDVCQTPDFRKLAADDHLRLVKDFFFHLTSGRRRVPEDWIARQYAGLDRTDGEIDALAGRLAGVRTLAYVANRPDWLADAGSWQAQTRGLEDRISDALHEKLMARFVDRRTSALMRGLRVREDMLAGVAADGAVTVEGHYVGRLTGVQFEAAQGASLLEQKALRAAATHAVGPEIARRLGRLAAEPDEAFTLSPDGVVLWRGEAAGALSGGQPFAPRVRLFGELGPESARQRAARRLEAYVAGEAARRLAALRQLEAAVAEGRLRGLARGVAYRLIEAGGVLDRADVRDEIKALSQVERRALRGLGVRIGAFSIYLPALLKPDARALTQALALRETPHWRPADGGLSRLPQPAPAARALSAYGLRAVRGLAVPVDQLERLDALLREGVKQGGGALLSDAGRDELDWSLAEAEQILRGLDFAPANRPKAGEPIAWRRRGERTRPALETASLARPHSPFAALSALQAPAAVPAPARRPRRRRKAAAR